MTRSHQEVLELFREQSTKSIINLFGTDAPFDDEIIAAEEILKDAPASTPLNVAQYFKNVTQVNNDGERYNSEWISRANPVIVFFFLQATHLESPAGDQTPWCAAFVNWCLERAGMRGTRSASSGSFRCYGRAASSPQPGDIAVFRQHRYYEPCEGKGHVGFYLGEEGDSIYILGGNQGNSINSTYYKMQGTNLGYLGCRLPIKSG